VLRALLLSGSCVLVGGCAQSGSAATTHPVAHPKSPAGVVPWIDRTRRLPRRPSPWARQGAASAEPCTGVDLGDGSVFMQGATGSMLGGVRLRDTTGHDCTLRGIPTLRLVARGGAVISTRLVRSGNGLWGQPRWPHYPIVSLRPNGQAVVDFAWRNYCGRSRLGSVRLAWRDGALTEPVTNRGAPECDLKSARSSLSVGRFQPDERAAPPPRAELPLRVDITAPAVARPGRRVIYRVTLVNYSAHTVSLRRCPTYWQGLSTDARTVTTVRRALVLNCRPTPTIPAGGHVTYAMEWVVPANSPTGPNALDWVFEPIGAGASGKTLLRITGAGD
jgi:hypothetical protein